VQILSEESTPRLGYPYGKELIDRKHPITALLAYNDISAIALCGAFM